MIDVFFFSVGPFFFFCVVAGNFLDQDLTSYSSYCTPKNSEDFLLTKPTF